MAELIYWIAVMSIIAAVAFAALIGIRAYMNGVSPAELLFKPRADTRLGVVEYANVDGRRKLLLVRRDNVEHLIMTGGPVDVVIETNIGESKPRAAEFGTAATATVFTRPPRPFGQAAAGAGTAGEG